MTAVSNLAPAIVKPGNPVAPPGVAPSGAAFPALLALSPETPEDAPPARQDDAAPGKDLPDAGDLTWIAPAPIMLPTAPIAPTGAVPDAAAAPIAIAGGRPEIREPAPPVSPQPDGDPAPAANAGAEPPVAAAGSLVAGVPRPADTVPEAADAPVGRVAAARNVAAERIAIAPSMVRAGPTATPITSAAPDAASRREAVQPITIAPLAVYPGVVAAPEDASRNAAGLPVLPAAIPASAAHAGPTAPAPQPTRGITPVAGPKGTAEPPPAPVAPAVAGAVTVTARPSAMPPIEIEAPTVPAGQARATAPRPVASPAAIAVAIAPPAPPTPTPLARIAPAAQVFAAAIQRASADDRATTAPQPALAAIALGTDDALHAVSALVDPRHAAIDLKQDDWPGQMIQRIEALRDAVNANDSSIRLIPDALGKIDVALKREGDGVSVRLVAHQPETRQILADAQPRLIELAEARGLKLSTATGGTADTGGQAMPQQQQQQPRAQQAAAPAHRTPTPADDTNMTDDRIA